MLFSNIQYKANFMGPTWGPPGSCRPQMGPMLDPWTLLLGIYDNNTGLVSHGVQSEIELDGSILGNGES